MENAIFTPESLMAHLISKYAYLNDDNAKAQEVYDKLISKQPK